MVPAKRGPRAGDLLATKRCPVNAGGAGLVRRAETDNGAAADQAWPVFLGTRLGDGRGDGVHVMAVNRENLPAIGLETAGRVVGHRKVGASVNGDAVVIEKDNQT